MIQHSVVRHTLNFKRPGGTSRGVLKQKDSWFLSVWHLDTPGVKGVGECSIIKGLSPDSIEHLDTLLDHLTWTDKGLSIQSEQAITSFPAVQFAVEQALLDLKNSGQKLLYNTPFSRGQRGIKINGLIWMGEPEFMQAQIQEKIKLGYRCVKLKIGAIDFNIESQLIRQIRKQYTSKDIEVRVDANGAFHPDDALEKLNTLSDFDLHSIEQPIKTGQWDRMAELCATSPLPIALDEELIGINLKNTGIELLKTIRPQYIILKPSLLGGVNKSEEWIRQAKKLNIGWWVTSALESNIGLNAIAQWTSTLNTNMFQGLGTGQLFSNNITSPLYIEEDLLRYDPEQNWGSI